MKISNQRIQCQVCHRMFLRKNIAYADVVRNSILENIMDDYPNWDSNGFICQKDLSFYRQKYISNLLEEERGQLSQVEKKVIRSIKKHKIIAENVNQQFDRQLTLGEKLADKVATFGGSWTFITLFTFILVIWIIINNLLLANKGFDPYPFILLNLVLSSLAAIQAPIIMMSQNRQSDKDRFMAEHDYQINLKSELEIRMLNEKIDHLLQRQWHRLLEIQQIQMDLMQELQENVPPVKKHSGR